MSKEQQLEEWRKKSCISFVNWIGENCIECISLELKYHYIGEGTEDYDSPEYNIEQLYNIWITNSLTPKDR